MPEIGQNSTDAHALGRWRIILTYHIGRTMKKDYTKQDFYDLLVPHGECLDWVGARHPQGYGLTKVGKKIVKTHRLVMELEGVNIDYVQVLHTCGRPQCCNPAHLILGTQRDNVDRKIKDKRQFSTISEEECEEIRELCKTGMYQYNIGAIYGISQAQVSRINTRLSWKHLK
tara:strand:+ start:213 stop:728 length:516 start_codon:yes stop_codon:yes gene_type:complete